VVTRAANQAELLSYLQVSVAMACDSISCSSVIADFVDEESDCKARRRDTVAHTVDCNFDSVASCALCISIISWPLSRAREYITVNK
jgi:hypothetical protein